MNKYFDDLESANLIIDGLIRKVIAKKLSSITLNIILFDILIYKILILAFDSIENHAVIGSIVLFSFVYYFLSINSKAFKAINKTNLLEHINRTLPQYNESSQIILEQSESPIKTILRNDVVKQLLSDYKQGVLSGILPSTGWKLPVLLCAALFLVSFYSEDIKHTLNKQLFKNEMNNEFVSGSNNANTNIKVSIDNILIRVYPPMYTRIKNSSTKDLNLDIQENSVVDWNLALNTKVEDVFINFISSIENDSKYRMLYDSKSNVYSYSQKIAQTQIYHFEVVDRGSTEVLDGVYGIFSIKDQPPKIKIVNPKQSLNEYPKSGTHTFSLSVDILDDYGISDVKILASVAKGSGEAVKFRDKIFEFDSVKENVIDGSKKISYRYKKQWQLKDLDMEPGDEVYFNVIAVDNRQPEVQQSKSSSVIVRWLDDEESELSAEGIRIGFIPEYFRSQRQIIIETIELIEDESDLTLVEFKEKSVDLGHSQNDLKTKYGQYLGDELGEGPGEHFGLADGYHGDGEVDNAGTAESNDDKLDHGDEHNESEESAKIGDGDALIEKFTHNHGTEEIAPLSSRDPKTWMKMAVSEMWRAELHLMLSEPKKALPFEQKAYKYLKQARKADRIYAKRLGFEPPPVTEERRLTGELNELGSNYINKVGFIERDSNQINIQSVFRLINQWRTLNKEQQELFEVNLSDLEMINRLKQDLLLLSKNRSVLIKYVAILERIRLNKKLSLKQCINCVNDLQKRLWTLISTPISLPNTKNNISGLSSQSEKKYLKAVRILISSPNKERRGENNE